MDSLAQLTLQRELELVIEKERRKQAKASERHKKRVSFVMKNSSREQPVSYTVTKMISLLHTLLFLYP